MIIWTHANYGLRDTYANVLRYWSYAITAVSLYGVITLLAAWQLEGWHRWAIVVAGTALVLLIGFSRLYLGVHYPSDVAAGYLAASFWFHGRHSPYPLALTLEHSEA